MFSLTTLSSKGHATPLERPIRDEIFSAERLEEFAAFLSSELPISFETRKGRSLLPRLEANYEFLRDVYRQLTKPIERDFELEPAAEWLIDNFHIVEDQVREVREDLPDKYYRKLPKITTGELEGYPRVYAMALSIVAHQDSHIDIDTVKRFVREYQSATPLKIGEIWAIAIALRIALIENLRRISTQILAAHKLNLWAHELATEILLKKDLSEDELARYIDMISEQILCADEKSCAIVVYLLKRLREQSDHVMPVCDYLDQHLEGKELTLEQSIHSEYQAQAIDQVSVGNIITSMRLLSNIDWEDFFESVNLVDPILELDPSGAYPLMNFASRDRYRHVIERIHQKTHHSEIEIAKTVLRLATEAQESEVEDKRLHHVGHYLIEEGIRQVERELSYRRGVSEYLRSLVYKYPTLIYFLALTTSVLIVMGVLSFIFLPTVAASPLPFALMLLLGLIPISDTCLNIINLYFTHLLPPRILPKIDLTKIPKTEVPDVFVVVPTIFSTKEAAARAIEGLEMRYIANQDENLSFALLSDFSDSDQESAPGDDELALYLSEEIRVLNERYASERDIFYLFHRKRIWNEKENKWMGRERKRGKIHEFNQFLRGSKETSFLIHPDYQDWFADVKYVITLDSDTQLPRGTARKLLGAILHPLNRPQFDVIKGRVTKGYGILQPRIGITPESAHRSLFSSIFSGNTGIDPYTTAVSDIYQDLFAEGIYTGKGLYVVDEFEHALKGRAPDNALLSHDLFEGLYARAALVTDIEFLDDYPSHYESLTRRQHRWTRGDWQLIPWLFSKGLPAISRWKIFDNLRRSLVAPLTFLWLVSAWIFFPESAGLWGLIVLAVLSLPPYVRATHNFFLHQRDLPWSGHLISVWEEFKVGLIQTALSIISLPHMAYLQLDAIGRTLYRVYLSKRNLLEWQSAADVEAAQKNREGLSPHAFWPAFVITLIVAFFSYSEPYALPFLGAWFAFPIVIKKICREYKKEKWQHTHKDLELLRSVIRRTWNYYETFSNEEENWLIPDNFQQDPKPVIAHRTSPTNIGLLLLSNCSAYDFGYLSAFELVERVGKTVETMLKMERRFGHFYNWYDSSTLAPLYPQYISTVDSGNLAGHLIAVKQTLLHLEEDLFFSHQIFRGVLDTLLIAQEKLEDFQKTHPKALAESACDLEPCFEVLKEGPTLNIWACRKRLDFLGSELRAMYRKARELTASFHSQDLEDYLLWLSKAIQSIEANQKLIASYVRWSEQDLQDVLALIKTQKSTLSFEHWASFIRGLEHLSSPSKWSMNCLTLITECDHYLSTKEDCEVMSFFRGALRASLNSSEELSSKAARLAERCQKFIDEMDFSVLYDRERKIFTIGYNVTDGRRDLSYYDLLASEARLASFIAISKGDVPQDHWFHLGRQMTNLFNRRVLVSWSASMFEYLMPLLVMKNYEGTLLGETHDSVVVQQMQYAATLGIPWGISESAYNVRDLQFNYQYGPFGVPGLGLKRGLVDDVVISPYSTALAALVAPGPAFENLKRLTEDGLLTDFGLFEAVDYTADRLQAGEKKSIVENFMAHHQGMVLVAYDNLLHQEIMQERFHRDLLVRSSELLLQERIPKKINLSNPRLEEVQQKREEKAILSPSLREIKYVNALYPQTQLLSNGSYSVMMGASGAGYSTGAGVALTRWTPDPLVEEGGTFFYIQDELSERHWSAAFLPLAQNADSYQTIYSEHKAEFICRREKLSSHMEVIVSAEDNVELRRISLTNFSAKDRVITLTSYLEPILTSHAADNAHMTFSNLFIETEYVPSKQALIAHRRRRSHDDADVWAFHLVSTRASKVEETQFESSRRNFLGRAQSLRNPAALAQGVRLQGMQGAVLDPILSLRETIHLKGGSSEELCFVSGLAGSREEVLRLIDQYHDLHAFEREDEMAWTKARAELHHQNIDYEDAALYQKLASHLIFPCGVLRAPRGVIAHNQKAQPALWSYGISGDLPILLLVIKNTHEVGAFKELLHAHIYLRLKGLHFDLVVVHADSSNYRQELHESLTHQLRVSGQQSLMNKRGGVFVIKRDSISDEDYVLLQSVARVYFVAELFELRKQLEQLSQQAQENLPLWKTGARESKVDPILKEEQVSESLVFYNGHGGFTDDGREYVILCGRDRVTPAPWINVIANKREFGFLVSERGSSCTWSDNSRENRLTPWSNDPISDPSGEVLYCYDNQLEAGWSATPAPMGGPELYTVRHGQGYTHFESTQYEISQQMTLFAHQSERAKIIQFALTNLSDRDRKIRVVYYADLVLGFSRTQCAPHIVTSVSNDFSGIYAQNAYNEDFGNRVSFVASDCEMSTFTCHRQSFLGRNGHYDAPIGLTYQDLGQEHGARLDPCVALAVDLVLAPGESREVNFILGQEDSREQAARLVNQVFKENGVKEAYEVVVGDWDKILSTLQIKTGLPEFDFLINRWALYQNLSCRIWARTAFYQSGGAFGFRDQLQDVSSLLFTRPDLAREHILRAASKQFVEGDVLHWWHPPSGKGVRTHFSDDLLWLPYIAATYLKVVGDDGLLSESASFISGPELPADREDMYFAPTASAETGTLYDHCTRAIDRSLAVGVHGLPLMGTGDWNDGMNRVGAGGTGESVWLGWFLASILKSFIPICEARGDGVRAKKYQEHLTNLLTAIEEQAWDGQWYLRAFFDDGTPLGSRASEECQIDSLSQSWAAITGLGEKERTKQALASLDQYLVRPKEELVLLFTPPFNKSDVDPGYIKGYIPGVRENGGQYTHAAVWSAMGFAAGGLAERAFEVMKIINPINHARTKEACERYRVEPYVIAADVYATEHYFAQGGWTWYTGSCGWFYRAFVESILGFGLEGDELVLSPIPTRQLDFYEIRYDHHGTIYEIQVENDLGDESTDQVKRVITLDGRELASERISLVKDGKTHLVKVRLTA